MKILIVPEIAARESSFVRPGEIQVVGYKEHLADISRLLDTQDKILAYDEAKEREPFARAMVELGRCNHVNAVLSDDDFYHFKSDWEVWKACAKSRARSAEQ